MMVGPSRTLKPRVGERAADDVLFMLGLRSAGAPNYVSVNPEQSDTHGTAASGPMVSK
jgi:hypothetical protein